MTVSTENATTPKSTKSRNSNCSVKIQMRPKSEFEFVPRDSEESEFLDLVHFEGYGVATISRLLKIIGLFCRLSSLS